MNTEARAAAAYIAAGTWDEAQNYFGLDQSFMWDEKRIVEQCREYREALKREDTQAAELARYRKMASNVLTFAKQVRASHTRAAIGAAHFDWVVSAVTKASKRKS